MTGTDAARPHQGDGPPNHTASSVPDPYDMPTVDDLIFEAGVMYERRRIATATAELDATWRGIGRIDYEHLVALRAARTDGKPDWPGLDNGGVLPSADWYPDSPDAARWARVIPLFPAGR